MKVRWAVVASWIEEREHRDGGRSTVDCSETRLVPGGHAEAFKVARMWVADPTLIRVSLGAGSAQLLEVVVVDRGAVPWRTMPVLERPLTVETDTVTGDSVSPRSVAQLRELHGAALSRPSELSWPEEQNQEIDDE